MNYCPIHSSLYLIIACWTQSYRTCNKKRLFLPPALVYFFAGFSSPFTFNHAEKRTHFKMKNHLPYSNLHFSCASCLHRHCKQQLSENRHLCSWEKWYNRALILKSARMVVCVVCEYKRQALLITMMCHASSMEVTYNNLSKLQNDCTKFIEAIERVALAPWLVLSHLL